jgi:hypothetical protein
MASKDVAWWTEWYHKWNFIKNSGITLSANGGNYQEEFNYNSTTTKLLDEHSIFGKKINNYDELLII